MPVPNTNASHDFIFAKLHGLWANAVKGDALDKLLRSGTPEALQRNLHAFGLDAPTREEFNKELMAREIRFLDRTARLLDEAAAEFYRSLIAKTYYPACYELGDVFIVCLYSKIGIDCALFVFFI